jgi:hypothetical protein
MLFGPGTVGAALIALAIITTGVLNRQPAQGLNAGRVAFEADGQGRMRRVEKVLANTGEPGPVAPLWKPEVSLLNENAYALNLSTAQQQKLTPLDESWRREKALLLAGMDQASAQTTQAAGTAQSLRGVPLSVIKQSLGDYSSLSRQYDERRRDYWAQATTPLSPAQRDKLDAVGASARKAKRP